MRSQSLRLVTATARPQRWQYGHHRSVVFPWRRGLGLPCSDCDGTNAPTSIDRAVPSQPALQESDRVHLVVSELAPLLQPIHGLAAPWYLAGGWAIDLFVGRVTRDHHDVDIVVARSNQGAVFEHFSGRTLLKVIPHPEGLVGRGALVPWNGEPFDLPAHQVFADDERGDRVEVLFAEISEGTWHYRRNPDVTLPIVDAVHSGDEGILFLAPEIVLLFKAPLMREWDERDFDTAVSLMIPDQRMWLADALDRSHVGHPWIDRLA